MITGATDGLGLALAQRLTRAGELPWFLGRRPLESLSDPLFDAHNYCQADLFSPDCLERLQLFLQQRQVKTLDLVVHNAGLGYFGPSGAQSELSIDELLTVNLEAPVRLTHGLLPQLLRAGGKVSFVSSVASQLPVPKYAVYGASKRALEGFARSLRYELQGRLQVQVVRPGAIRTGMHPKMGLTRGELNWQRFPSADRVAQQLERALQSSASTVTLGLANEVLAGLGNVPALAEMALRRQRDLEAPPRAGLATPRLCLITGAAQGIGRALMFALSKAGYRCIGVDLEGESSRQTQRDLEAAGYLSSFFETDLSSSPQLRELGVQLSNLPPLSLLIHNAGINAVGPFENQAWSGQQRVLDVNLRAPLQLTAAILQNGGLASGGTVVFVSSLSHFVGYPGASVYAATKDGLAAYARSLALALAPSRHVLTVFPGPVRTEHARRYSPDNSQEHRRMVPEDLALRIVHAIEQRRSLLLPGFTAQCLALLGWLCPQVATSLLGHVLFRKISANHFILPSKTAEKQNSEES